MAATTTRTEPTMNLAGRRTALGKPETAARRRAATMIHDRRRFRDEYPDLARHEGIWANPAALVASARKGGFSMASMYLTGGYNTNKREPFSPPNLSRAREYARAADLLGAIYVRVLDVRDSAKVAA
ncbi:MAG: hypothetical protein ACOH10_15030 [Rhodoglobus sp.]